MYRTASAHGQTFLVLTRELATCASCPKLRTETSTANSYELRNRSTGSRSIVTTLGCLSNRSTRE